MTGVRIAATLGGFFSLMVLLVVYKSKCKSKSLSDEHLNAAAAAVAIQDEEQQLAAAAACIYSRTLCASSVRGPRRSLGNMSAPAVVIARGARRFSSIGGYSALEPPSSSYYYQRGKSLPGSALRFHVRSEEDRGSSLVPSFATRDRTHNDVEEEEEDSVLASPCCYHQFLTVPSCPDARRLSSITCSSSDTSYLERRGSAVELGIPAPPPFPYKSRAKGSNGPDVTMAEEPWDFYYPIDIQVIQPTPEVSPCGSERTLYNHPMELAPPGLRPPSRGSIAELTTSSLNVPARLAPLASISSIGGSLTDYPDFDDMHSIGSDSVFLDEGQELDTEDEVEGFSTDSEDNDFDNDDMCRQRRPWEKIEGKSFPMSPSPPLTVPYLQPSLPSHKSFTPICHWGAAGSNGFHPRRRLSMPGCHYHHGHKNKSSCAIIGAEVAETVSHGDEPDLPTSSRSCQSRMPCSDISQRPQYPLPVPETSSTSSTESLTLLTNSRTCSQQPPINKVGAEKRHPVQQQPISSPYRGAKSCESLTIASIPSSSSKMLGLPSLPLLSRGSCEHLIKALNEKTSTPPIKNCSWSQETLF